MIIEKTRDKRADHKIMTFKCKMNRWWLVNSSRNGFEIMDGKRERIATAIPAYHIEWVMQIMNTIHHSLLFCHQQKVSLFIDCLQILRNTNIPFAIRGIFH